MVFLWRLTPMNYTFLYIGFLSIIGVKTMSLGFSSIKKGSITK